MILLSSVVPGLSVSSLVGMWPRADRTTRTISSGQRRLRSSGHINKGIDNDRSVSVWRSGVPRDAVRHVSIAPRLFTPLAAQDFERSSHTILCILYSRVQGFATKHAGNVKQDQIGHIELATLESVQKVPLFRCSEI
jgi:hypothetical protein